MIITFVKDRIKQWILLCMCRIGLLTNNNEIDFSDLDTIDASTYKVTPLCKSTNTIICLESENKKFFFRECKKHCKPQLYVEKLNSDYLFWNKSNNTPRISNFSKFMKMGMLANQTSRVRMFYENGNPEVIGIQSSTTENNYKELKEYVDYSWSEIYNYWLNCGKKMGEYQTYNSSRAISFYLIAKLLGADDLVPNTRYIVLKGLGETERIGILMDEAEGVSFNSIAYSLCRKKFSPLLQKNLLNLHLLDTICFEKDHRPDNYNVLLDIYERPVSICVFDNDSPMSFFPTKSISFFSYEGCSPLIDRKGYINRPYMDGNLCKRVLELSEDEIQRNLEKHLSHAQIIFLNKRIKKIQDALMKSITSKKCVLLNEEILWNKKTVEEEISGQYGQTYLSLFASDWINEMS